MIRQELFSPRCGLTARGFPEGSLERIAGYVAQADDCGAPFDRVMARLYVTSAHLFGGRADAALEAIEVGIGIELEARSVTYGRLEFLRARALVARGISSRPGISSSA